MSIYANIFSDRIGAPDDFGGAEGVHFRQSVDPIEPSNKVLCLRTVSSEGELASVTTILDSDYEGEGGYCEVGLRYYFEPIARLSQPRYFTVELRDEKGAAVVALNFEAIEYSGGEGTAKIAIKHSDGRLVDGAILNAGRWYSIKLELYQGVEERLRLTVWEGTEMLAFSDAELAESVGAARSAVILHHARGIEGISYFDDIFFALGDKKYSYLPSEESVAVNIYDFEDGIPSTRDFHIEMLLSDGGERNLLDPATWTSALQSEHFKRSRNLCEILLVLSGSGSYVTRGERLPFEPGSIFVSAPGVSRQIISSGGYKMLSVAGIFEKLSFVKDVWALSDNVYGEGRKIAELILYNRFGRESYVESLASAYVEYLLLSYKAPEKNTTVGIYRIIEKINQHFGQSDLSVGTLLEESGYTRDYIRAEFVAVTKMTPKKYLNNLRMQHAKSLIEMHGDGMTLSEIAEACGIIDQSIFSRIFKKHFGISPTEYKESLKK